MKREELLMQLTEIDFTALDLQLFLNTHPDDMKAIEQYNMAVAKSQSLREEYEKAYGPLRSFRSPSKNDNFSWIDNPWPWERNFI